MLHAPAGSYLFHLAEVMTRIENLSHVLAWARFDETATLADAEALSHSDLLVVTLPRLKLTFQARRVGSVVRLFSVDHADLYISNERNQMTTQLLAGLPHSLLLSNSNGEMSVLVPTVPPCRPNIVSSCPAHTSTWPCASIPSRSPSQPAISLTPSGRHILHRVARLAPCVRTHRLAAAGALLDRAGAQPLRQGLVRRRREPVLRLPRPRVALLPLLDDARVGALPHAAALPQPAVQGRRAAHRHGRLRHRPDARGEQLAPVHDQPEGVVRPAPGRARVPPQDLARDARLARLAAVVSGVVRTRALLRSHPAAVEAPPAALAIERARLLPL
eukprot:1000432-Prymnesium_polylepis.2